MVISGRFIVHAPIVFTCIMHDRLWPKRTVSPQSYVVLYYQPPVIQQPPPPQQQQQEYGDPIGGRCPAAHITVVAMEDVLDLVALLWAQREAVQNLRKSTEKNASLVNACSDPTAGISFCWDLPAAANETRPKPTRSTGMYVP